MLIYVKSDMFKVRVQAQQSIYILSQSVQVMQSENLSYHLENRSKYSAHNDFKILGPLLPSTAVGRCHCFVQGFVKSAWSSCAIPADVLLFSFPP